MTLTFDQAKDHITQLVKAFRTNLAQYRAPGYKEAHTRSEFIDPLC